MLIRKATKQDASVIAEINVKTWKVAYKGLLSDEILDKRCVTEEKVEYLKDAIGSKGKICFVAEDNGEVIGYLDGGNSRYDDVPVEYEVYGFYVLPTMQRKGVGKALLDAFKQEVNNEPFYLYALKDNQKARAFYIKNGGDELPEFEKKLPEKYNSALESLFMFNL